jgi:hypothetical protein
MGSTFTGGWVPMNSSYFATPEAAAAIAKVVGGEAIPDPMMAPFTFTAKSLAIRMPNGIVVNAGLICAVMGNDAYYANAGTKSGEICNMLQLPFDANLADRLFEAFGV